MILSHARGCCILWKLYQWHFWSLERNKGVLWSHTKNYDQKTSGKISGVLRGKGWSCGNKDANTTCCVTSSHRFWVQPSHQHARSHRGELSASWPEHQSYKFNPRWGSKFICQFRDRCVFPLLSAPFSPNRELFRRTGFDEELRSFNWLVPIILVGFYARRKQVESRRCISWWRKLLLMTNANWVLEWDCADCNWLFWH